MENEKVILAVRLSPENWKDARAIATKQNRPLSNWVAYLMQQAIEEHKESNS